NTLFHSFRSAVTSSQPAIIPELSLQSHRFLAASHLQGNPVGMPDGSRIIVQYADVQPAKFSGRKVESGKIPRELKRVEWQQPKSGFSTRSPGRGFSRGSPVPGSD